MTKITPPRFKFLLAASAIAALLPLRADAIGLGRVVSDPVMGKPLALEIPLLDAGTSLSVDCFQLQPHPSGSDSLFYPRRAKLDYVKKEDGTAVLQLRGPEFLQPIIEFRIGIGCGHAVARDYVQFLAPGNELRYEPVALNLPASPAANPGAGQTLTAAPPRAVAETAPRPARPGPSLEQMAGSRFPEDAARREQFKRFMREINPQELNGVSDETPIALDVNLRFPDEKAEKANTAAVAVTQVPAAPPVEKTQQPVEKKTAVVKSADKKPLQKKPVAARPEAVSKPVAPPVTPPVVDAAPPKAAEKPAGDRLSISSGAGAEGAKAPVGSAEGALQEKAGASFAAQDEMAAQLARTEASYNELKDLIKGMESRMAALEQERQRLQQESLKKSDLSVLEIALMILGGGLLGAAGMNLAQRRRRESYSPLPLDIGHPGK